MKVLLVWPEIPDTFWGFKRALRLIFKKAVLPPLGLLQVAAMLPKDWELRLVDLNVSKLENKDIAWADLVFISAMVVQKQAVAELIKRVHQLGRKVVAGGPLFTSEKELYQDVDYLVLNEAEVTLPMFLEDLAKGSLRHIYESDRRPDLSQTPPPLYRLIWDTMKKYSSMSLQYSRGCPFDCEFCDIVFLNGHNPRTKTVAQILAELDVLYEMGWRSGVFVVDDNFIGNKNKLKAELLPELIKWQIAHGYPFSLSTEASINLADDEKLMFLMTEAGFSQVFVGLETPNNDSLDECNKKQNMGRDLAVSVAILQAHGFDVQGGFIVGFDRDPVTIFKSQIAFIQNSGIVIAMVGLLNVPKGTRLHQRLQEAGRLTHDFTGDNTSGFLGFVPKMDERVLLGGYLDVLRSIYSPKAYYYRLENFLRAYTPVRGKIGRSQVFQLRHVVGFVSTTWAAGVWDSGRFYYWGTFYKTLFTQPSKIAIVVIKAAQYYHLRAISERTIRELDKQLKAGARI